MIVVQAMAGAGSRVRAAGADLLKPLVAVDGEPLFRGALAALPVDDATVVLVVSPALAAHEPVGLVRERWPGADVREVVLAEPTRGQADTVALGLDAIGAADSAEPLLVFNCDTWLRDPVDVAALLPPWAAGGLQLFHASGSHWSFARVAGDRVLEVAEKRRISDWCSTGLYAFDTCRRFRHAAAAAESRRPASVEAYVAPLYSELLDRGESVAACFADGVLPLGTPEELDAHDPDWRRAARRYHVQAASGSSAGPTSGAAPVAGARP